jgi:hypothetical protein
VLHRVEDAALHGLQAVTHVGQRAGRDDAERVVEVPTLRLFGEGSVGDERRRRGRRSLSARGRPSLAFPPGVAFGGGGIQGERELIGARQRGSFRRGSEVLRRVHRRSVRDGGRRQCLRSSALAKPSVHPPAAARPRADRAPGGPVARSDAARVRAAGRPRGGAAARSSRFRCPGAPTGRCGPRCRAEGRSHRGRAGAWAGHPRRGDRRQPTHRVGRCPRLPVRRPHWQGVHPRGHRPGRARALGFWLFRRRAGGSLPPRRGRAHPRHRAREAQHQGGRVGRQLGDRRRGSDRGAQRRGEDRQRALLRRAPPRCAEDPRQIRRRRLFPRRSDVRGPARARQRGEREVHGHRAAEGERAAHHLHRQPQHPRRGAARGDDHRAVEPARLRLGRPFRQDAFERDVLVLNVPLLRPRLPRRADRHAPRDAHARSQRHRDHPRHPGGPTLQDPPSARVRASTTTAASRAHRRSPRPA